METFDIKCCELDLEITGETMLLCENTGRRYLYIDCIHMKNSSTVKYGENIRDTMLSLDLFPNLYDAAFDECKRLEGW